MRALTRLTLILLGTTFVSFWASAQNAACFADWSSASAIVKSQGLVTLEHLTKLGPSKLGGEIVRSSLCDSPSGFVYKLIVRNSSGQLKNITVDARHPFGQ